MEKNTIALFIDADNISAAAAADIFARARSFGEPIIRRAYGTVQCFSSTDGWQAAQREYGIVARPQVSNVKGKNVADIALVIDAMEALYRSDCTGICIVSSDSDFTALAAKVREGGKAVYGLGGKKTPESFRAACTQFVELPLRALPAKAGAAKKGLLCPRCGSHLVVTRTKSNKGCEACPACGGMAAKIAVLKGVFTEDGLEEILKRAQRCESKGCVCPDCGSAMSIVKASVGKKSVEIDVCAKCRTVWYDRNEFEALVANDGALQPTVSAGKAYRREMVLAIAADLKSGHLKVLNLKSLQNVMKSAYHMPSPDILPVVSTLRSQKIFRVDKDGKVVIQR